jgi:hypothetical protein
LQSAVWRVRGIFEEAERESLEMYEEMELLKGLEVIMECGKPLFTSHEWGALDAVPRDFRET